MRCVCCLLLRRAFVVLCGVVLVCCVYGCGVLWCGVLCCCFVFDGCCVRVMCLWLCFVVKFSVVMLVVVIVLLVCLYCLCGGILVMLVWGVFGYCVVVHLCLCSVCVVLCWLFECCCVVVCDCWCVM